MTVRNFRDLIAWNKAMDSVEGTYRIASNWPKDEVYGLTSQARRAVVSVPSSIAEGQGRQGVREYLHHVSIATGSVYAVQTHLLVAQRLGYPGTEACDTLVAQAIEVARLLHGLTRSLKQAEAAG